MGFIIEYTLIIHMWNNLGLLVSYCMWFYLFYQLFVTIAGDKGKLSYFFKILIKMLEPF